MSYNSELQSNNADLLAILDAVNALPEAGGGGETGGSETSELTLVGEALLDADADVIRIDLSKKCKHVIVCYKPFGSASVTNTASQGPYCYANFDLWGVAPYATAFGGYKMEGHRFDGNNAKWASQFIEYELLWPTALVSKGWFSTGYLLDDANPLQFPYPGAVKAATHAFGACNKIDTDGIENIVLQVWNVVWGAGTHIWVYGR